MAEIIYGKNGTAKATAKSVRYTGQFMGVPQLEVEIDGPVPLGFEVGDYIVFSYDGIKYSIMDLPPVTKQASAGSTGDAFVYDSVVFKSPLGLLANVDFLDTVLNENNVHYSTLPVFEFYGTVKDFADRLQANINRLHTGWKVSVEGYDDSTNPNYDTLHEYNNISISNIKCSDSLSIPYETWGITYVFMVDAEGNNCIVFNHALDSASAKRYGEGNGLYTLTKRMSTEKPVVNRLRAYGSTDNLPARYYNNLDGIDEGIYLPNLMIPRSKWKNQNDPITAYIDSTDIDENDTSMSEYGVREKSIYFDGSNGTEKIEPTIKGVTAGMIRAAKEEMGDTSNVPSATLYPDDERMDKVVEAESVADKGVESDGEVYVDSVDFSISKTNGTVAAYTKNGDAALSVTLNTDLEISTPATYKIRLSSSFPILTLNGGDSGIETVRIGESSAVFYTKDDSGNRYECFSVPVYWRRNVDAHTVDVYLSTSEESLQTELYIRIPKAGTLEIDLYLYLYSLVPGAEYSYTCPKQDVTAWQGPLILQDKFWVRIKQIGFDINSYPSAEEAKLVVNSGGCAGRSFNIVKNSTQFDEATGTWTFECFRSQDESLNQLFPNSIYKISEDDEFVLTGLEMPDLYVQMASQKLYDEAVKWLWKHKDGLEVFSLDIDNKVAYLDSVKIKEGMLLPLYDRNLNVGSEAENEEGETVITYDYRIIDSVTIEIGEESIPVITAVLREEKEESIFKSLIKAVNNVSARTDRNIVRTEIFRISEEVVRNSAPTTSASSPSVSNPDLSDFVTLSTEQTVTAKKTFAGDVVLGGQRQDGSYGRAFVPSHAGPGVYDLYISSEPIAGEIPSGSGGIDETELWSILGTWGTQQIDASHISNALAGYATQLWVEGRGYLTSSALTPYATKEWVEQQGYLKSVSMSSVGIHASWQAALAGQMPDYATSDELSSALNGYYTSDEVDDELAKYVTLSTEQTVSGKKTFTALLTATGGLSGSNADFSGYVSAAKLYVPSYNGNKVYDLYVSDEPIAGEAPSGGGGLDEAELWSILTDGGSGERIAKAHLPLDVVYTSDISGFLTSVPRATASAYGGIKTGFPESGKNYPVELNSSGQAYVNVPWTDTTYTLSSFGITATAAEINKLDGAGTLLHSGNYTSYSYPTTLALISGLHSSWDALLKAAKPTTLAGYGITNAYTQSEVDTKLFAYLPLAGGTMNDGAEIKFSFYEGRRVLRIHEGLNWDMSNTTGGYVNVYAQHIDPAGASYTGMGVYGETNGLMYFYLGGSYTSPWMALTPSGNVGIGTTAPAYTLDVRGEIRATSGITLSRADDYGWYISTGTRISAGISEARGVNVGSLLVSNAWADYTKVPTNGIYSKGDIWTGGRLYVPSYSGNQVYDLYISNAPVSGEAPSGSSGIDETELWSILTDNAGGERIAKAHLPLDTVFAADLDGYITSVSLATISDLNPGWDALLKAAPSAYVTRWPTASEVGALTQSAADGRYAYKGGSNATGTWPISISGNAASADISNYLYLNPNNGSHVAQNDAVPANGRFAIYDVNTNTTAGGNDGYIMAFRWPSGNYVSQIYVDVGNTGIMALRHRDSANVWSGWSRILHSSNIGSYALTKSNYSDTLDSRYLLKSTYTAADVLAKIKTVDGAGSGLDADLLDGVQLTSLASAHHYLTNAGRTTGYYKILINSTAPWMLYFRIRLYQSYNYYDIDISGYNYHSEETNYSWYMPKAKLVSSNVDSVKVYFGHDSANKLWVAVPAQQYTGLAIYDVVNGYNEISKFNAFTISYVSSLSGTTDSTQTCYRGASINDNVASATKLANSRTLWGRPFDGMENVSGAISSTGNITPSAAGSYNIGTASLWYERIYGRYIDTASPFRHLPAMSASAPPPPPINWMWPELCGRRAASRQRALHPARP